MRSPGHMRRLVLTAASTSLEYAQAPVAQFCAIDLKATWPLINRPTRRMFLSSGVKLKRWGQVQSSIPKGPHPEEAALLRGRLEGWPRHRLVPSFETHRYAMLLRMRPVFGSPPQHASSVRAEALLESTVADKDPRRARPRRCRSRFAGK